MSPKSQPALDCAQAREEIQTFAGSRIPAARGRILRSHLLECGDCKSFYKETIETAASLGSNLRANREAKLAEQSETRRAAQRSVDKLRRSRPNHSRLRTVMLPAFFFFLMVSVTKLAWPDDKVRVTEWGGPVFLNDEPFGFEGVPKKIRRGSWLVTGASGKVSIETGDSAIQLGERTFLLVEEPGAHRFRFRGGELTVAGPSLVTTTHGVLEVIDGAARLEARGARFELVCESGTIAFTDASGTQKLTATDRVLRDIH